MTPEHRLLGAPSAGQAPTPLYNAPGPHLFGTELAAVEQCPGAERALGMGLTEAMVRYAVRREYALTVEDILARRWRALFLDAQIAMAMAPAVAAILDEEHGADPSLEAFLTLCRHYLPAAR